ARKTTRICRTWSANSGCHLGRSNIGFYLMYDVPLHERYPFEENCHGATSLRCRPCRVGDDIERFCPDPGTRPWWPRQWAGAAAALLQRVLESAPGTDRRSR